MLRWALIRLGALVALSAFALTGCAEEERTFCGGGASRFPGETLEDWKSYSDHLAVFTVVDRRELPPDPGDSSRAPPIPWATIRVDRVMWSAPESSPGEWCKSSAPWSSV
jgi:hypothetical protein